MGSVGKLSSSPCGDFSEESVIDETNLSSSENPPEVRVCIWLRSLLPSLVTFFSNIRKPWRKKKRMGEQV